MATSLVVSLDKTALCGQLIFSDDTPIGSGTGYDTVGGVVLSSITATSLAYSNLDGSDVGFLWSGTDWIPETGAMSNTIDYPNLLGVYQLTYTVVGLDDADEPVTLTVTKMVLFDCAVESCLRTKVLNVAKQGCGCCNGCGNGLDQAKISWMWTQLEAVRISFEGGYYNCLDTVLDSILAKCDNACSSC
jgi:hypothetical protein